MADDVISESEKTQMRRVLTIQKVAWVIVVKWLWLCILLLILFGGGFTAILRFKSATSLSRFEATTRLLFSPQRVAKIDNLSDKQLMSILERPSLKFRVNSRLESCGAVKEHGELTVKQEKRPTNLYTLTATAPTRECAVNMANTYAEVLIDEYVAYRTIDLENRRSAIDARRKKLMEQLAENEAESSTLKAKTGIVSPTDVLATLNSLISDQRRNLSMLGVDVANEETRRRKLDAVVGGAGAAIIENAAGIRRRSDAIAALDKEIAELRVIYTDINPKVAGKIHDRAEHVKEMQEFLKLKKVESLDMDRLDEIEKAAGELAACGTRLEALAERQRALSEELKGNEKKAEQLMALIPEHERLVARHNDLEHSVRKLDEELSDMTYLMSSLRNDLRQVERADEASDNGGLAIKMIAVAVLGAIICSGTVLLWVLLLEFVFGKVRGGKELSAYDSIGFIGSLPKPKKLSPSETNEVLGVVALKLLGADVPRGIMLVCRLPGVSESTGFWEVLDYTASMSGVRVFTLNVISSGTFTPPEGAEQMIGTVKKEEKGWFPVLNRYALAPTELEILKADLAELRNSFDTVFICMEGGFRKGGSFFDQLLSISESVVLMVGTARTPRSWFNYVRRHVETVGKPMLAIAADASAKIVRREMGAK